MNEWRIGAFVAVALVLVLGQGIAQVQRRKAIRALGEKLGFTYIGNALPGSFALHGDLLERITAVWNTLDGELCGLRVLVFDCRIGQGKGSWRRTIIAAKSPQAKFHSIDNNFDMETLRTGDWTILYRPKELALFASGLMPVPEVEARLSALLT